MIGDPTLWTGLCVDVQYAMWHALLDDPERKIRDIRRSEWNAALRSSLDKVHGAWSAERRDALAAAHDATALSTSAWREALDCVSPTLPHPNLRPRSQR